MLSNEACAGIGTAMLDYGKFLYLFLYAFIFLDNFSMLNYLTICITSITYFTNRIKVKGSSGVIIFFDKSQEY